MHATPAGGDNYSGVPILDLADLCIMIVFEPWFERPINSDSRHEYVVIYRSLVLCYGATLPPNIERASPRLASPRHASLWPDPLLR